MNWVEPRGDLLESRCSGAQLLCLLRKSFLCCIQQDLSLAEGALLVSDQLVGFVPFPGKHQKIAASAKADCLADRLLAVGDSEVRCLRTEEGFRDLEDDLHWILASGVVRGQNAEVG